MRKLLIFLVPIVAIGIALLMQQMRPEPPKKDTLDLDPLVDVQVLETMTANFTVNSQGTVLPRTETVLSAEVSGTVTSISPKFIPGGVFDRGEVLMRIDPTNYEGAVKQAEALVKQRQIEHDGAEKLRSQGYRAEAELASAAAALATAEAELVRARRNLARTYIRLPYEGMVRSKDADLGQFVNPGTRLGVMFATDHAEVRLPLTDSDLAFVDLPNASEMTAAGNSDGPAVRLSATQKGKLVEWDAQIVRSEGVVDEKSRVTYAVARIADPYRRHSEGAPLPVGTFVTARIEGAEAESIIRVPRGVVRGSNELLFVDENGKIEIRSVGIVRSDAEYSYVASGAQAGERIVVSALEAPIRGMTVRTRADTDTAARIASTDNEDDG
ncbi:MAG: efflux RND transporter periplasmic adaptor subunit [Gammaproteobacteria bacterium]|nr:efflux RND transporter periplasmic adaptor subunit [Gammaproteobacteria bacterium]MDH5617668.1 efflux RND transporter periplasmic adaptor subunit [Gammaproteobacteria bacterium]